MDTPTPPQYGIEAAEKLKAALSALGYDQATMAKVMILADLAARYDVGQMLLEKIPQDKQKELEDKVAQGTDPSELSSYVPDVSKDWVKSQIEHYLNDVANELTELLPTPDEARKYVESVFLAPGQQQEQQTPTPQGQPQL